MGQDWVSRSGSGRKAAPEEERERRSSHPEETARGEMVRGVVPISPIIRR